MRIFFSIFALGIFVLPSSGLTANQEKEYLILSGKVIKMEKMDIDEGTADAFSIIDYEVLNVCEGEYAKKIIKVAHQVGTAKDLEIGNVVCLKLEKTERFKKQEQYFRETGIYYPKELIADYIYSGYQQACICSISK